MKKLILIASVVALTGCKSELYDCHVVTENHLFKETKLCDGACDPMVKITDVVKQINEEHVIVKKNELQSTINARYDAANMVNDMHPEFTKQIGYNPVKIIQMDCKKI